MTADPAAFLSSLQQLVPGLEDIDPEAELAVKDYAAGGLRNMNEEQISRLSAQQIGHIREGLEPHGDTIALLGYAV